MATSLQLQGCVATTESTSPLRGACMQGRIQDFEMEGAHKLV